MSDEPTVTVWLDHDEAYPVLIVSTEEASYRQKCEVPKSVIDRFRAAEAEYGDAHEALWKYYRPEDPA